jgi:hypothetical protein
MAGIVPNAHDTSTACACASGDAAIPDASATRATTCTIGPGTIGTPASVTDTASAHPVTNPGPAIRIANTTVRTDTDTKYSGTRTGGENALPDASATRATTSTIRHSTVGTPASVTGTASANPATNPGPAIHAANATVRAATDTKYYGAPKASFDANRPNAGSETEILAAAGTGNCRI